MGFKISQLLRSTDIYGQAITVNYDGSDVYRTKLGGLATIATYVLMLVNLYGLVTDFFNNSRQNESQSTQYFDSFYAEEFNL